MLTRGERWGQRTANFVAALIMALSMSYLVGSTPKLCLFLGSPHPWLVFIAIFAGAFLGFEHHSSVDARHKE
jgi:hypothetical protein